MPEKDYYAVLGVGQNATAVDIRSAFLQRALERHPDRGGTHAQMVELSQAVEVLADPRKRRLYDTARATPQDPIALAKWRDAEGEVDAAAYPANTADFGAWLDAITADVERTTGGRILAGFFAGAAFGIVAGFAVGYFMAIPLLIAAGIGCVAGALGGAFAAASNAPPPRSAPDSR